MKQLAIVTIVSNNYLHYARTLMQSVALHHPEAKPYCVIVDADLSPSAELSQEFEAIPLSSLDLPFGDEFLFQYTILELNTAVKPWALQHLLDLGHSQVLYIDPDIYLYKPLQEVTDLLNDGASVVLTPHLLEPITDTQNPTELSIRMAGTYNLGFCALSEQHVTRQFLKWWQAKLERNCVVDFPNGVFVDQSWVDLAPGLFDHVRVLRHPGYNVAYWNLAQRQFSGEADQYKVNQQDLVFFHFSGIDPQQPQNLSKHQNRFSLDTVEPIVKTLVLQYCSNVVANGLDKFRNLPYAYARFKNDSLISAEMRKQYRLSPRLRKTMGEKPFEWSKPLNVSPNSTGPERLNDIYYYFLNRSPDPSALQRYVNSGEQLFSYLKTALAVGISPESRRIRGWKRRLLLWPFWLAVKSSMSDGVPVYAAASHQNENPSEKIIKSKITSKALGINLIGYINAELGVGEAARSLARACRATGVPYSVVDVGFQSSNLQRDREALLHASDSRFSIDMVYVNADQTVSIIEHLKDNHLESAYKIGFWHWEQPEIPQSHFASFEHLDEIWVPSTFVYDAVAAVSPVPVVIIPHALHVKATPGADRNEFGLPADKLLALMMYDFHSYQYRKNPQAAIAAFREAIKGRNDAVLVVKTINSEHHPEASAELNDYLADLPGTIVLDQFLTRQQTWDLQSCCDMLISLHRAEGFGLAPAEMMALGKPVVATGWSANMDFMNHENSMPVKYTLQALEKTIGAYPAGPLWAEADIDHAASCIRQLLDQPELRLRLGQQAMRDIQKQLNPETVGKLVKDRLSTISHWNPSLRGKDMSTV
ncbi:glycosyltransferase [Undibacterium sp. Ji50W]|uniref:glycosyltransferase n=1 Tax=Undibacterium sp. Ji50W TaxID=3413041 RepID=UPI003BF3EF53